METEVSQEIRERLEKRLQEIKVCKTLEELSFSIWSKKFEEATGSSKREYRDCFIEWVSAFKEKRLPNLWNRYKTVENLVCAIWYPYLDNNEEDILWFGSLRNELTVWIENYLKS
jgi:hypothetical protein